MYEMILTILSFISSRLSQNQEKDEKKYISEMIENSTEIEVFARNEGLIVFKKII